MRIISGWLALGGILFFHHQAVAKDFDPPNIVLIYGDDIGYGDMGCYGAATIPTPHIDELAKQGVRFTSGYSTSATCTPSRYSLLTGEYAWRKKGTGIAPPNATALIEPGRTTLASILQQAGYETGIVGKWHLGLGEPPKPNWSGKIAPGPLEIGFDYCFLMPTTNDRVPCVYIENHRIVNLDPQDPVDVFNYNPDGQPTGITERSSLKLDWSHGHNNSIVNGIGRIGFMTGGQDARWVDEEMTNVFTSKAVEFIECNKARPFFLFFASQNIHVPRTPNARFVGATPHGARGDAMVEFDASVGVLLDAIQAAGIADKTLVIVSSDNGPVLDNGYKDGAVEKIGNHRPAGPFRGGKSSSFEGGTRVPLITHWPGHILPGVSNALISQVDFAASFRTLAGATSKLPSHAIPDSQDQSAALTGQSPTGRDYLVEDARVLSLRKGPWKYIEPSLKSKINRNTKTELGNSPQPQLYNLSNDPGETENLAGEFPDRVDKMKTLLDDIRETGNR